MNPRAQISATTFIFFMILSLVVAGYVIRTFLVPAVTSFEQGALTKSIANVKGAYAAVCEGRSVGAQVSISVPAKGVFLVYSCKELMGADTISLVSGKPLPVETVTELKAKCSSLYSSCTTLGSGGCLGVCKSGACVPACTDTDAGNVYAQGMCTDSSAACASGCDDFCTPRGDLDEVKCVSGKCADKVVACPSGYSCSNGACVTVTGTSTPIPTPAPTAIPIPSDMCFILPDDTPCDVSTLETRAVLAYGWDRSWDWWFIHEANVEIKRELLACGKPVSAMLALGHGEYQKQLRLERDVTDDKETVRLT